jgi:hypothetical protein
MAAAPMHVAAAQLGRSGFKIGIAYAARKARAATMSGTSVARSHCSVVRFLITDSFCDAVPPTLQAGDTSATLIPSASNRKRQPELGQRRYLGQKIMSCGPAARRDA